MNVLNRAELVAALTHLILYDRSPDGRSHAPDDLMERMKIVAG